MYSAVNDIKWIYVELIEVGYKPNIYHDRVHCGLFAGMIEVEGSIFVALRKGKIGVTELFNMNSFDIMSIQAGAAMREDILFLFTCKKEDQTTAIKKLEHFMELLLSQKRLQVCKKFVYTTTYANIPEKVSRHLEGSHFDNKDSNKNTTIEKNNEQSNTQSAPIYKSGHKYSGAYSGVYSSKAVSFAHYRTERKPTFFERTDKIALIDKEALTNKIEDNRYIHVEEEPSYKSYYVL